MSKLCVYIMANPVITADDLLPRLRSAVSRRIIFPERSTHPKLLEKAIRMYVHMRDDNRKDAETHLFTYSRFVVEVIRDCVVRGTLSANDVELRIPVVNSELDVVDFAVGGINELGTLYGELPDDLFQEEAEFVKEASRRRHSMRETRGVTYGCA